MFALLWFQPSGSSSSSSGFSLSLPGVQEDTSLLNQGFLQAKSEKPVTTLKPRSCLSTPAPVSIVLLVCCAGPP